MTVASASSGFREKVHPLNMMVFSFLYGEPIMFSEILKTISLHAVQKLYLRVGVLSLAANESTPTLKYGFGATHHVPGRWGELDIFVRIFRDHHPCRVAVPSILTARAFFELFRTRMYLYLLGAWRPL